ncbi:hypothetical protein OPV22_005270 [Ensete ventricosum]|uniref:Uncharacterized protein n=1 Tax=Ensete ventricosum TaxID=4639 RepID=A0AAV8RKM4_ENSVE|nr:hypothetical protein OPV22_005270 [Ensete ventricosum]
MKNNTVVHQLLQVSSSSSEGETEEGAVARIEETPPNWNVANGVRTGLTIHKRRLLSKQLSMRETRMEAKWEKRRSQIHQKRCVMERGVVGEGGEGDEVAAAAAEGSERRLNGKTKGLTDEDLDELRGSIDLGFGFSEVEGGQDLCDTLPALNLYFAVNRQLSDPKIQSSPSPASTPTATSSSSTLCGLPSPRSPNEQSDSWKICNPGDNPQHVKTRLRHWAQAVACSLRQSC